MNISGLPNPVTPILGLRVHGWVPIAVVENDSVRPRQIDPHTARSCTQNEGKVLAVIIEPTKEPGSVSRNKWAPSIPLHKALPHFYPCAAIKPHVHIAMVVEEGLEHIKHLGHLGEDEHPVPAGLQGAQQVCEDLQLAAVVLDQPSVGSLHGKPGDTEFKNPMTSC